MPFCDIDTDVKPWLGIPLANTTYDSVLIILRDSVEQSVLNYTGASFSPVVKQGELKDSNGSDVIVMDSYPIISVEQILFDVESDGTGGSLIDPEFYHLDKGGSVTLRAVNQRRGRFIVRVDYTYGYASLPPDVKQAILISIEAEYRRKQDKTMGKTGRSKKDESENYEGSAGLWDARSGLPRDAVSKLNQYRVNVEFPIQPMAQRNN